MAMPLCPECKIPVLWAASPERPPGEEGWCPGCGNAYASPDKPAEAAVQPAGDGVVTSIAAKATGIPFRLREMASGHLELTTDDGGGPWRLDGPQARTFGEALLVGATMVKLRLERMRGVDRWGLRRRGEQVFGRTGEEERALVPFRVGKPRYAYAKGFVCNGCGQGLSMGATAYKAADLSWKGNVEWAHVRFCAPCVEAAQPEARQGLRLVREERPSHPGKVVKCRGD